MTHRSVSLGVLSLTAAVAACEPANITDARDQLSRGPLRTVEYRLPVVSDSAAIGSIFGDLLGVGTITLPDSLVAVVTSAQTLVVGVGGVVGSITGVLDPAILNFPVEEWQAFTAQGLNLEEFRDAIQGATLNVALVALAVTNTADAPLTLSGFTLGVVQIDPGTGQPRRDAGNNLIYEADSLGTPILVPIVDPGDTAFAVGHMETGKVDTLQAAALVDRLVDLLLDTIPTALVGAGTVSVGDGMVGTVQSSDQLTIRMEPIIGLDLTLSPAGIGFDIDTVIGGLSLGLDAADDLAGLIDSAAIRIAAVNGTAFELEAALAIVSGAVTGDVFAVPGAAVIDTLRVSPAIVDANGRVMQRVADTTQATLSGDEISQVFDDQFTTSLRILLLPPPGGRGAIRVTDHLIVRVSVIVWVTVGGGGQ